MRIKSKYKALLSIVLAFVLVFTTVSPVYAWKPKTHVLSANLILEELQTNNGYLTFPYFGKIKVPDEYLTAILSYPDYFRAGSIGPDGFPDIYVGQVFAHPKTKLSAGDWIKYMIDQVKKMPAGSEERKQVLAFALGYTVHASGDLFGHSYVNLLAQGSWPDIADADGISEADMKIIVRHNVVEEYIDKKIPAKFSSAAYNKITAPKQFIYNHFITNGKAANYDNVGSDALDISPFYARTGAIPKHFQTFYDIRRELKTGIGTRESYNPVRIYQEYWFEDIDEGMKAWLDTSEKVAQDLLSPEEGFTKAKDHLMEWAIHHYLSMVGFPDVAGWIIGAISDLSDMIGEIIPDYLDEIIKEMKNCFYDVIFKWAFGVKYTQLVAMTENPEQFLNDKAYFPAGSESKLRGDMSNFSSATTAVSHNFHPFKNSLRMAKLNLIGQEGMEELLRLADMEYLGTSSYPPICFIKSLDVGYDWNDISFAGLNIWDDYDARAKIFDNIFNAETSKYRWFSKNERTVIDAYNSVMVEDPSAGDMIVYTMLVGDGWTQADVEKDLRQRLANQAQLDDYRRKTEITEEQLMQDTVIDSLNAGYGRAVYKTLNLNGKKLTVNCNLEIDRMGIINVDQGTLVVNGDLTIKERGVIIQDISQGGILNVAGGTVIVHGNLKFQGGIVDIGGGSITVDSDLEQTGGLMNVNEGKINIRNTYALSMISRPLPGATGKYATEYFYRDGIGILKMKNDVDHVLVGGSFITTSKRPHDRYLTDGTLEVKGDFYQASWAHGCKLSNGVADLKPEEAVDYSGMYNSNNESRTNFKASGKHRVLLSGSAIQKVGMINTGESDSQFSTLEITNPTEVKFVTKVTVGELFNHNGRSFTLSSADDSIFPDYDGDGLKDNIDSTPCPPAQDPITGSGNPGQGSNGSIIAPRLPEDFIVPRPPHLPGLPNGNEPDPSAILRDPLTPGLPGSGGMVRPVVPGSTGTIPGLHVIPPQPGKPPITPDIPSITPGTPPVIPGRPPITPGEPPITPSIPPTKPDTPAAKTYAIPANMKAVPGENSAKLQWDDIISPDIIGYKLMRQVGAGSYTPVVDLIIEDNYYTDQGVIAGNTYVYICRAVYKDGNESEPSGQVSVAPFGSETPGLSATLDGNSILFELPDFYKEGVAGFNIYKGTVSGQQGPEPINNAPIANMEYKDTGIRAGTTYYYVSTIVYEDGSESETSAEISVVVP